MIPLDFPPDTSTIQSVIDDRFQLRVLLGELIDNALDKHATRISLTLDGSDFIVEDNGTGVANMISLLQWGNHHKDSDDIRRSSFGRFGIGLKHAAIWIAEEMAVQTRYHDRRYSLQVNWQQIMDSGLWRGEMEEPQQDSGASYTRFTFGPVRPGRIKQATLETAKKLLNYEYTPALTNKIVISINGNSLEPMPLPALNSVITLDEYFEGRHFRLSAGLKPLGNSEPGRCGYDVAYLNRIIVQHDSYGLGEYSGKQFYGYLELLDDGNEPWTLSTHKGHFAEADDLYDYLLPLIEPLLQAAEQMGDEIKLSGVRDKILKAMSNIRPIREKRKRGETKGSAEPKNTGRRRTNAEKVDPNEPGSVIQRRLQGILDVRFDCHDPGKIGDVQQTKSHTIVSLNPDFEIIKSRELGPIVSTVLSLLAAYIVKNPEQKSKFGMSSMMFPEILTEGFYNDFQAIYSDLLRRVDLNEAAAAAAD